MFLEYLLTDLTFFVIALNFNSNVCSLAIIKVIKQFQNLTANKVLINTRLLFIKALESSLHYLITEIDLTVQRLWSNFESEGGGAHNASEASTMADPTRGIPIPWYFDPA